MERPTGHEFTKGECITVFEYGDGTYVANEGYSDEHESDMYRVEIDGEVIVVPSTFCFSVGADGTPFRRWRMGAAEIEVTESPIKIRFRGSPVRVRYSDDDDDEDADEEIFRDGDELPKDWEGQGIDFGMIIEKWLRRLNSERIPLSDYYQDPVNRWLDGLGE
jgi:hypothetical protein